MLAQTIQKKRESGFGNLRPLMGQDYASVDKGDAMNKSRGGRKEVRDERSGATQSSNVDGWREVGETQLLPSST